MSLNDWVTRQAKGGGQDDKSNKRRRKKPKQFDDEKTMMYRLRFAGKYVEDKKNTFDRISRGPDKRVHASREARRRMVQEQERRETEARKIKRVQARDKAILRELNLGEFEKARTEQNVASAFQEKFGVLSEKYAYISKVEQQLTIKLQQLEDSRTKKVLANRATPAMLTKDVEMLERLVLTRQQRTSSVEHRNDMKKNRIDGQRLTLVLQKEKLTKLLNKRNEREASIRRLLLKEQEMSKETEEFDETNNALSTLLSEDAKAFKLKWKKQMHLLHMAQQSKKKDAVKDKGHIEHAKKIDMLRRKASLHAMERSKEKSVKEKRKQYIDSMEEAFETITRETGIESLDELVDTFLRSEHRNFSVYNHINELNRNIEEAVAQTRILKTELSRYSKQYSKSGVSRTEKVNELSKKRERLEQKAQEYIASTEKYEAVSKKIQPLMLKLFSMMGCDQQDLNKELVKNGINDLNIQSVLGIMEQQATTIANLHRTSTGDQEEKPKKKDKALDDGSAVIGLLSAQSVKAPMPPSFGDFDPDGNDQGKHGSRRGSMLTVAPVDVTNVRLDVKQRLETGNYRKHRVIRRVNVNNLSNEEREQQMKQIKAMQKKLRKEKQSGDDSDFDSDDEDKHHQKSRRATGMAGRRSSIAINDDKENKKKRRQSSVGMRRVLV